MKKFLKLIKGKHDFAGFKASGSEVENNVRTVYNAKLKKVGLYCYFYISGNGFLYKMVRNIVGTMLQIGMRKIDYDYIKKHLFVDYKSTVTAKPEYLFLYNVNYL